MRIGSFPNVNICYPLIKTLAHMRNKRWIKENLTLQNLKFLASKSDPITMFSFCYEQLFSTMVLGSGAGLTLPDPGIFITSKAQGGGGFCPPSKMRNIAYEILKFCMYVVLVISNLSSDFQLLRVVF